MLPKLDECLQRLAALVPELEEIPWEYSRAWCPLETVDLQVPGFNFVGNLKIALETRR